ncbi:ABC transporter ATP-binding protein [Massilia glaciei]|uniref:ABC transporter ATP-binding protein n=1 Tax=Massilia glaciei TaxID=1524097 RepID=A0A2U2HJV3_9BURK|nr:ABC transporter ATP-binding protein [Massilia glaciei]PWF47724.1 ABC transporter ATP-binding protein [Massilia glaciei]
MNIPALHFQQVVKHFSSTPVLKGIDLRVGRGELFGLVGVNGAGKTSLIKCLLDFVALDAGRIDIEGRPHLSPAARAPLAFLPERFMPPWYLTGGQFLATMRKLHRAGYGPPAVEQMLGALALEPDVLRKKVRKLSKGMTQQLGLAACLLSDKKILVLDEPLGGLDPLARAAVKRQLRRRGGGETVFLSAHSLADVEQICDRIAILHGGRLRFVGSPAACRESYGGASLEQAFIACVGEGTSGAAHGCASAPPQRDLA